MRLGKKLQHQRKLRGYTLKQVAHAIGRSISFLSDVERGRVYPSMETLFNLTVFYDISLSKLVEGVETPYNIRMKLSEKLSLPLDTTPKKDYNGR